MIMTYIGVDIIEIARIKKAIARWGEEFLHRVYTESELRLCRGKVSSLAARFAGKEAVIKVLAKDGKGIFLRDIEILAEPGGKPLVHLSGKAHNMAQDLGLDKVAISLSHSKEHAIAFALGNPRADSS